LSVCGQFESQLCKTDANYLPSAMAESSCFLTYDTDAELNAAACVEGLKFDLSMGVDFFGDGQPDMFCIISADLTSAAECNAKFPNGLTTCLYVTFFVSPVAAWLPLHLCFVFPCSPFQGSPMFSLTTCAEDAYEWR